MHGYDDSTYHAANTKLANGCHLDLLLNTGVAIIKEVVEPECALNDPVTDMGNDFAQLSHDQGSSGDDQATQIFHRPTSLALPNARWSQEEMEDQNEDS